MSLAILSNNLIRSQVPEHTKLSKCQPMFPFFSVVLAINNYIGNYGSETSQAFSIYPFGYDELSFNFPNNTEVNFSCHLVFNNKLYLFGGDHQMRQISQVSGCGLERVGNLEFDLFAGACTVILNKQIMLRVGQAGHYFLLYLLIGLFL